MIIIVQVEWHHQASWEPSSNILIQKSLIRSWFSLAWPWHQRGLGCFVFFIHIRGTAWWHAICLLIVLAKMLHTKQWPMKPMRSSRPPEPPRWFEHRRCHQSIVLLNQHGTTSSSQYGEWDDWDFSGNLRWWSSIGALTDEWLLRLRLWEASQESDSHGLLHSVFSWFVALKVRLPPESSHSTAPNVTDMSWCKQKPTGHQWPLEWIGHIYSFIFNIE